MLREITRARRSNHGSRLGLYALLTRSGFNEF
jgi:hypothetical protein